jgi:hypothetical protein
MDQARTRSSFRLNPRNISRIDAALLVRVDARRGAHRDAVSCSTHKRSGDGRCDGLHVRRTNRRAHLPETLLVRLRSGAVDDADVGLAVAV